MNQLNEPQGSSNSPPIIDMASATIGDVAIAFLDGCDGGFGRQAVAHLCLPDASFIAQCDQLAGIDRLSDYCDWMQNLLVCMPDATYSVRSLGIDEARHNVTLFVMMTGTHTAEGGPIPPTGKAISAEYVYAMEFHDNRISHMTKIWNDPWSLRQLGWA